MTGPADTIREALAFASMDDPWSSGVDEYRERLRKARAALTELEQQAAAKEGEWVRKPMWDAMLARAEAAEADRDRWQREHENLLNWIEEHVGKGGTQKRLDHLNGPRLADTLREMADALLEMTQHPDHVSDEVRKERNRHALDLVARAALATPDTPPDA